MNGIRVKLALVAVAMLLTACGGPSRSAGGPGLDFGPRTAGECAPEEYPAELPIAAMMVDTAALSEDLRTLTSEANDPGGFVELSMAYQRDGMNMRRDVYRHDVSAAMADTVQKLVFAHRRTLPEAEEEWGARLRIDLDDGVSYRVDRREYCPPTPRNRELESAMRSFTGTGPAYRGGRRQQVALVRVLVHPAGYVAGAGVIRGAAAGSTLERDLVNYIREFSFEPATIDGVPTYGHIDVPVRFRG